MSKKLILHIELDPSTGQMEMQNNTTPLEALGLLQLAAFVLMRQAPQSERERVGRVERVDPSVVPLITQRRDR